MSEETRGLIYRALVVVFFALVVFGVLTQEVADNYMNTIIEVAALLGFGLASRNTAGPGGNK
jgi:hypothetical protein